MLAASGLLLLDARGALAAGKLFPDVIGLDPGTLKVIGAVTVGVNANKLKSPVARRDAFAPWPVLRGLRRIHIAEALSYRRILPDR